MATGDTRSLLRLFRCERVDDPAWEREATGLDLIELTAVLTMAAQSRDPIRMPSGLRKALANGWRDVRQEWIAWMNERLDLTAKESA